MAAAIPVARAPRRVGALLARTALVLSIAALPVAFNAWIDPARLVAPRAAEREIARVLASGRAVTDFANYDDRAIERHLAPLRRGQPDVLVLGSSRMQVLRGCGGAPVRQCANGFVNGAMQGATLDDVLGVYGLYDVAERRPRRVVLGVDPWTESLSGTGWRSVADERALVMRRAGIPGSPRREQLAVWARSVRTLATPEYFRLALYSFRRHGTRGIEWRPTDAERNAGKTKLPDGAVVWTDASPERAAAAARAFATNGITLDERFRDLERRAVGRDGALERFVRYLGGEGVGVTLVLVPFAPEVYDAARRLPGRTIVEVERELLAMAARTKVQIVGSYDPRAVGMTTREFFDESHPRPEALARVVGQAVRAP